MLLFKPNELWPGILHTFDHTARLKVYVDHNTGVMLRREVLNHHGKAVRSVDDLMAVLEAHDVGQKVTLTVLRGSETLKVAITLQAAE